MSLEMPDRSNNAPASSAVTGGAAPPSRPSFWWKVTNLGLLVTALAAPLPFGAVQSWAWNALLIAALGLLITWAAATKGDRVLRVYWTPLYLLGALFLLAGIAQYFGHLTLDSYATREALLGFTTQLVFFFLAGQVVARAGKRTLARFGSVVLIYAFLLSLFAIVQLLAGNGLIYWTVKPRWGSLIVGPYVNHNHYAGLMELLVPISVAYVLSRPKDYPGKLLLGFGAMLPLASLLMSGSRGGLVSLLAETAILIWVVLCGAPRLRRRSLAVTIAAGVIAVDLLFLWVAPEWIVQRLESTTKVVSSQELVLGDRLNVSKDSLRAFHDHPWLGTGLGTFAEVFPQYQSFPSDLQYDHAHDDYAEVLAEMGVAGGALIVLALFFGFRAAFRDLKTRLAQESGWIQAGATIGCCGLLVHSFVDFNLHIPANAMWFALSLAIATSRHSDYH
jgi:O-antigen ligase